MFLHQMVVLDGKYIIVEVSLLVNLLFTNFTVWSHILSTGGDALSTLPIYIGSGTYLD